MVGIFRKPARSLRFNIAHYLGTAGHWPHLAKMLGRHGITLIFDVVYFRNSA